MEENKKTSCSVVIVIILMLMVLGLGGYIAYDKILSNKDTKEVENDNGDVIEKSNDEELVGEIDLTKSLNSPNTYSYKLSNGLSNLMTITLNSDNKSATLKIAGFSDEENNIEGEYIISGFNKKIKEAFVGVIGQDITGYVALFLMEDNTIEYVHLLKLGDGIECEFNNKTNDGYITEGTIKGVTDVVKMYTATLSVIQNETYMYMFTILAAKEDGSFYDLYKTNANVIK